METCQRSNDWWNCRRQSCINYIYLFKQKFKPISYFIKKCKDLATNPVIFWRLRLRYPNDWNNFNSYHFRIYGVGKDNRGVYRCTAYASDGRKEKDYVLDFKGIAIV